MNELSSREYASDTTHSLSKETNQADYALASEQKGSTLPGALRAYSSPFLQHSQPSLQQSTKTLLVAMVSKFLGEVRASTD